MHNLSDYNQYLNFSLKEFQNFQLTKLKEFFKVIKTNSRYYSKSLASYEHMESYSEFQSLPCLEQEYLRKTPLDEMRAASWADMVTISSSSGTTGKSKIVLWTESALKEENKWNTLGYLLLGVRAESRLAMLMPLELSRCPSYLEACRTIGAFAVPFGRIRNDIEMENAIIKMKELGVTHIHCSTSRLLSITQKAKELGFNLKSDFKLKHLYGASLFVSKKTRGYIETEWGGEFFDTYGANEASYIGGECQMHDGLHLLPGISYVEVVNQDTGKQITDNQSMGEILVTNFSNFGTPLLRYHVGDLGTISYSQCKCGLSFPRLYIKGRTAFTLYIGGTKLDAYEVDAALSKSTKVTHNYQAIVEKKSNIDYITFRIECFDINAINSTEKKLLIKYLEKASFERVQIQLQVAPRQWNKQLFPFKKICICGSCGGSVTAELKYRRTKANIVNSHIYYHCNRIKKYDCPEPYITEQELIKQLIGYLPRIKLNTSYLMQEFEVEVKRLQHFKANVISDYIPRVEITPHNIGNQSQREYNETHTEMLKEYLLHVLQFGTPEERLKILKGVTSKFKLTNRELMLN